MMPDTIQIVVVDDHPLYREGVVKTLEGEDDITVCAEGSSGNEAYELVDRLKPDIVLLDISMPDSGLDAAQKIATTNPYVKIIMLTVSEDDSDIMTALESGARGYVLKGIGAPELIAVIRTVATGGSYVTPSLAARVLVAMQSPVKQAIEENLIDSLTKREEQILRLVAEGKSNKEVGNELEIQEKTVKHYMTNILQKMQVRNRVEAAIMAHDVWKKKPG